MTKSYKDSEITWEIKKEYLKEHLDSVHRMLEDWMMEINAPPPFALVDHLLGWQSKYDTSLEFDPDKKHMLKQHLRSRAFWRHNTDWGTKLSDIWDLINSIRESATKKLSDSSVNKGYKRLEDYINTALWKGFEIARSRDMKIDYRIPDDNKGVSFGAFKIEESVTSPEDQDLVKKEHSAFSEQLSTSDSMQRLVELWNEIREVQQSMGKIVVKIIKSRDILYPCRFCRHLWK